MRKSLGSKRNIMDESDIAIITRSFGQFVTEQARELDKPAEVKSNRGRQAAHQTAPMPKTFASKIFNSHEFGYRRITIERPLRESYQFSDERIATLRFSPTKPLHAPMQWLYQEYGEPYWSDNIACPLYGQLADYEDEIRKQLKIDFKTLKEKQIKDLLNQQLWLDQKDILLNARQLQQAMDTEQHNNMNPYAAKITAACSKQGLRLTAKQKKQIVTAVSWKNPEAEKVIKKIHKKTVANPNYGLFALDGQILEYKPDSNLRDYENIAIDPSQGVNAINEAYFAKEVQPHVADAWIDRNKKDAQDSEIGIVGYEIPFNRHFYQYQPPRDLAEIDADLAKVSGEIMRLLQEVSS